MPVPPRTREGQESEKRGTDRREEGGGRRREDGRNKERQVKGSGGGRWRAWEEGGKGR